MKAFSTLLTFTLLLLFATPLFSNVDVKGTVNYHNENKTPLSGINVFLKDLNGNIIAEDITKNQGKFTFKNVQPGTYKLTASSDLTFDLIDLSDAYLLLGYLLNNVEFTNMQLLAADINQNGTVDWDDYWDLVNGWFVNGERGMIGNLLFEEKEIIVEAGQFKAAPIIEGTANGDTDPPDRDIKPIIKNLSKNFEVVQSDNNSSKDYDDQKYPVYFKSESKISGFMLVFNIKNGIEFIQDVLSSDEINYSITNNQVRISWLNYKNEMVNEEIPVVSFLIDAQNAEQIELELDKSSHLIDGNGKKIQAKIILPQFINRDNENELAPIYPNPVSESATIEYSINNDYHVSLDLYNASGQLIYSLVNENQSSGMYKVTLNTQLLNLQSGNYIYKLSCSGETPFNDAKILIVK